MQRARGWAAQQKPDIVWATRREGITQKQTDFRSSKCLREQPAQANEASPQVVQLQMGSEHRNCQEMGSSMCLRSGGYQPGCAQTPKPFLVTASSPSTSFQRKSHESRKAGGWCEMQRAPCAVLLILMSPDVLVSPGSPGRDVPAARTVPLHPRCCLPGNPTVLQRNPSSCS